MAAKATPQPAVKAAKAAPSDWHPSRGEGRLPVGAVVKVDGRLWCVGMVNDSRARLDPLTGASVTPDPESGRCFTTYGQSINIAPNSLVEIVSRESLSPATLNRLERVLAMNAAAAANGGGNGNGKSKGKGKHVNSARDVADSADGAEESDTMADTVTVSAAPIPRGQKKARGRKPAKATKVRATKVKKAKVEKELSPCKCGCGEKTTSYFVAGHDARFKGWLLKIERGDATKEKLLKKSVIDQYTWVKRGDGEVPTTNYKGEPHKGYDKS